MNITPDGWEDMFQEGCMGLIHAANNYDPNRGNAFSTYAYSCIRGYVLIAMNRKYPPLNPYDPIDPDQYPTYVPKHVEHPLEHLQLKEFAETIERWGKNDVDIRTFYEYIYLNKNQEVIAQEKGLSRQAVSLRIRKGKDRIKKRLYARGEDHAREIHGL
jgi:RNA polymerase sigma factor (sigma-70 family)